MRKWVDIEFQIGDIVFLKTDSDQRERIITGITIREKGMISYELSQGTVAGWHYGFEISSTVDTLKKVKNNEV